MNMLGKGLGILSLCLFFMSTAFAEPAHRESVLQLMKLMNVEDGLRNSQARVLPALKASVMQAMPYLRENPEQLAIFDQAFDEMVAMIQQEMNPASMMDDFVRLYMETFTQEEVVELIKFYGSPVGQSYLAKMPELMEKSLKLSADKMMPLLPGIMKAVEARIQSRLQALQKKPVSQGQ